MTAKETTLARGGHKAKSAGIPLSAAMILVTLGVVYGDIGTSPMYTLKAIISGNGGLATMSEDVVLGALSLIIWTLTLITTVKYVLVAMKADNHNEGGIFALYSLVKRCGRWLIIPAMIGGAALLADGNRRQQIAEALAGCLERLPETQRQSIRLFFFDDCSYADIAAATSWHLKSIRSYIQNGKRNLKNCLRNKLP